MNPFIQKPTDNPYVTDCEARIALEQDNDGNPRCLTLTLVRAQDGKCRGYLYYKDAGGPPEEILGCFEMPAHLFVPVTGAPERLNPDVVRAQAPAMVRALEGLVACVDGMDHHEFDIDFDNAHRHARLVLEAAKKQA
jgi:hypothetical protein